MWIQDQFFPAVLAQRLCAERVRRAQDLLENTDDTIERVASRCGFGSAHQMRTHFTRINQVTPHGYQWTFRSAPPPETAQFDQAGRLRVQPAR